MLHGVEFLLWSLITLWVSHFQLTWMVIIIMKLATLDLTCALVVYKHVLLGVIYDVA
jgi:hypothetical protein